MNTILKVCWPLPPLRRLTAGFLFKVHGRWADGTWVASAGSVRGAAGAANRLNVQPELSVVVCCCCCSRASGDKLMRRGASLSWLGRRNQRILAAADAGQTPGGWAEESPVAGQYTTNSGSDSYGTYKWMKWMKWMKTLAYTSSATLKNFVFI